MESVLKLLILEDIAGDADLEMAALKRARLVCKSLRAEGQHDFVTQVDAFCPDAVLSGFTPPADEGWSLLDFMREKKPDVPLIVVSGAIGEEQAVEALKRGAADYVARSNLARLPSVLKRALDEAENRKRAARLARVEAVRAAIASAIARNSDRQKLFEAACRIAAEQGGFRLAWMGLVTPEASALKPIASSGHDAGYLEKVARLAVRVNQDDCRGKGDVFKRFGSVVVNDILEEKHFLLKDDALTRGYRSMIALPLIAGHRVAAVFKIYATEPNYFRTEERKVLAEIAGDLSFALDHQAREERLCRLAYHDALTGLANRRLLYEHMKQELARAHREKTTVAVVFVDLDNFKTVNDTFGHSAGDRLLMEVSTRIASCTREGDIVARMGGDEFVMVLPIQSDRDTVLAIVDRVVENVSRPVRFGNRKLAVSCSIGVAVYPEDGRDYATLLRNADAAMYQAKPTGVPSARARENVVKIRAASGAR
jgi:diguanylate cyclase (GGDEF)-like protein